MSKQNPETPIVKACLHVCNLDGLMAWRNNTFALKTERHFLRAGIPGSGDILGLIPWLGGRFITIEVKRPGKYPNPAQRDFIDRVRTAGGIALVVYSGEQLHRELTALKIKEKQNPTVGISKAYMDQVIKDTLKKVATRRLRKKWHPKRRSRSSRKTK